MNKFIISLLFVLSFLLLDCSSNGEVHTSNEQSQLESKYSQLNEIVRSRFYVENTIFPDLGLNDSLRISDLRKGSLFIRISELHCQECIKDLASFINQHFQNNKHLIVFLGQFKSERAMSIYLRRLNLLEVNYFLVNEIDGVVLEDTLAPYAFLLNSENRIDNLWLPHYSLPNLSNEYILAMSKRLIK